MIFFIMLNLDWGLSFYHECVMNTVVDLDKQKETTDNREQNSDIFIQPDFLMTIVRCKKK